MTASLSASHALRCSFLKHLILQDAEMGEPGR